MSIVEKIKAKFHITVTPMINEIDDENYNDNNSHSTECGPSTMDRPNSVTIILRPQWSMVAAHPIFQMEYKNYIRNELGGEIEIKDNEVTYIGKFPRLSRCPNNTAIFANKTNNYMQKLKYQTLHDLKPHHVNILRANSTTVAFNRIHRNDYMIAAKPQDLFELRNKLFPKTNQYHQNERIYIAKNHQYDNRSTSNLLTKPPVAHTSFYSVATTEGISMFSINTFEARLQQHLKETYNVKVNIERKKTKEEKIHIIIELIGQMNDVKGALDDLINLFSSIRTRKFNDKIDGNWTKINEAIDVIQYHFTLNNFLCICQKISLTDVYVNYFDLTNPQFGIDEQKIEDLINNQFSALDDLINLFSSIRTRKFNDKIDGNWTKINEAIDVIQYHFTLNNFLCICQKISLTDVNVNYFDLTNPQFGIDEQKIEDLINNQFSLATIIFIPQSISSKFTKEWINLEEIISKRNDYKKDICFYNETNILYLFGLTKLVKEFHQKFEQIKNKYVPQPCKITLSDKQLKFLRYVAKSDLNKLEKQYKIDGCDLSLTRLQHHGHFLAPLDLHTKIKESLESLAQITEIKFEIKSSAFAILINNEPERLLSIVKSKCYLEKQIQTHHINISIPIAQIVDHEDRSQQTQNVQKTNSTSINIGKSTITIAIGDLTVQTYAAHRDEYKQRYRQLDERLLFHGCLGTSANQIVQECFNRSFAGVNGVAYGCGVYFHSNANYSHSYAKPSTSGERTMFLARVLIGKTCLGSPSMKVPPAGYDTTTDGQNIFVIYHDAGAYADHLITYK
ncbi:unnamed protein product [Rotaria sp. Silwood1]|nr:unnamed protein product [Rotaria sp. Silwood1]